MLLARNNAGVVEGCGYDSLSILELSRQRVTVAKLEPGDPLEIITDHKPGSRDCYIRMLQVIPPAPPPSRARPVASHGPTLTFRTGIARFPASSSGTTPGRSPCVRATASRRCCCAKTRATWPMAPSRIPPLAVNTRVFVRAGPNLDGGIEAYQVMWGEIVSVQ